MKKTTSKRNGKPTNGKVRRGSKDVQTVFADLPKNLVTDFKVIVALKSSRMNTELAEAVRLYLQQNAPVLRRK